MKVVCTAGHVDHGKSTLVTALTGQQPDRLAEEQRRGLTIDLGFAWTTLDTVGDVAFVDLPGHERFVPNMLAGAGSVSVALFVVAADEGWMPQSAEHLAILDLLGVRLGVVALTRCDLADEETVEIAVELTRDQLEGSGLAQAPVIPVSAVTGAGLPALREALATVLRAAPESVDMGRPRLWVDRSFSVRGAGTVVTGTLRDGGVAIGDHLEVHPGGRGVRVRGMQALGREVAVAAPGWRVALNLTGVDADEVGRGDVVVGGRWVPTAAVEVWSRTTAGGVLGRRGAWRLHAGTAVVDAELYPVGGQDLHGPGPLRVELGQPLVLTMGDRVVLREMGRSATVGGGFVLDPTPGPRVRGAAARSRRRTALRRAAGALEEVDGTPADAASGRLAALVRLRGAGETGAVLAAANAAATTPRGPDVVDLGSHLVEAEQWDVWAHLAVRAVVKVHQSRPALTAVDKAAPRQLLRDADCPPDLIEPILHALVEQDRLVAVRGGLAAPGHEPRLTIAQQSARTALFARLYDVGFEPPPLAALAEEVDADQDLLDVLHADGQLVALPELAASLPAEQLSRAAEVLAKAFDGPFTASEARTALDTTRKYALPLLEALDAAGMTRREGDTRTTL